MKIAVATEDGKTISAHFGRSPFFAIYEIADGKVINQEMRRNTFTGHFRGGVAHEDGHHDHGKGDEHAHQTVAEGLQDCQTVISHGMGRRAWEDLCSRGIEMIVTDETEVERALNLYLVGELKDRTEKLH
ncbi:iron-molybdenum cofactor biosynthesis protein [candidate division KSB1 bacterium]|nr:MAG: iron-molybdenum cofactor biosynthesis protein [candidate division KSB1 bacterium]MBC6948233.1 iron-molybdenum cofactor biosynthesis protein [candidate division KSB1 bacterium]MCE7941929.1 iron-molybdenum cofactor biosynthesis protein [Chlorobi bacterium CHB1]MDL1876148.1 iron-molybdenum cofactor biosynthesis protein [Cytophagia bacterium CHB2]